MSIDWSQLKFAKPVRPEKRPTRLKRQSERAKREQPTLDAAKANAWKRDRGQCRAKETLPHDCQGGPLDPAHLPDWRRALTRGRPAVDRHPARGIITICRLVHDALDQGRMTARYDLRRGANGPVTFEWTR